MKPKKTVPSRRRISFAVDREEIEVNSDWVEAVMASSPPAPSSQPSSPPGFIVPVENNATDEESASVAHSSTAEECSSVEETAPVVQDAAVEQLSTAENPTTVANDATVACSPEIPPGSSAPEEIAETSGVATVDESATVEEFAAVEENTALTGDSAGDASGVAARKAGRLSRPRRIVRITDGLTPGQYAVYSLMYGAGEAAGDAARIYKGGYADLVRLTGLSKRGIQNVVAELQGKLVIRLERQPGHHRTETSAYYLPGADAVLAIWFQKGWRHATGKGKALIP